MKQSIYIVGLIACINANAGDAVTLALPSAPGSYQSDSFRADGMDCSMAIGSGTTVEFGVVGVINANNNGSPTTSVSGNPMDQQNKNIGVYGRITIPIGGPKTRLDCNELYQLELRKKRMEIQRLEAELANLRNNKFEK